MTFEEMQEMLEKYSVGGRITRIEAENGQCTIWFKKKGEEKFFRFYVYDGGIGAKDEVHHPGPFPVLGLSWK